MKAPFTTEQFFEVFEKYNLGVFPSQILILILGIAGVLLIHARNPIKHKSIGGLLGLLWLWMGTVYQIGYLSSINKAAYVFGGLFILQGLFILYESYIKNRLGFRFKGQLTDYLGYFFILFGFLMLSDKKLAKYLLIIPSLWALI